MEEINGIQKSFLIDLK